MAVIGVVLACFLVSATVVGFLAWRLPNFDPAAPRAASGSIVEEVVVHSGLRRILRSRFDSTTLTGLALTLTLAIVLVGVVAAGTLLVMVQHNAGLARYDLGAAHWGASNATNGSTRFLRNVSLLGGTPVMVVIAISAAIIEYARTRTRAVVGFLALVVIGQLILQNVTKLIVNRDRPDIHRLTGFSGSSFPSGHSVTAAATFAAVALLVGRGRSQRVKACLAGAAAGLAVAVATTRVFLGVHWLTDVLAGLAMGWAWFAISSIAFGGRLLRFGQPVEVAQHVEESLDEDQPVTHA
jgi:membrane-associated phospholipid phosphatase